VVQFLTAVGHVGVYLHTNVKETLHSLWSLKCRTYNMTCELTIKVEVPTLHVVVSRDRFRTSQPLTHTIFHLPSSIELFEVLRGRALGRTDRIDIHDCLVSSTLGLRRKERTFELSSKSNFVGHLPRSSYLTPTTVEFVESPSNLS